MQTERENWNKKKKNRDNGKDEDKKSTSDKKPFNKQYKMMIKRHGGFIKLNRTRFGGKMTRNKVIINISLSENLKTHIKTEIYIKKIC